MNGLFELLNKSGSGCWINNIFYGITGFSDDSIILAPNQDALQEMLDICDKYAIEHNLKFSTDSDPKKSKMKCLAFQRKPAPLKGSFHNKKLVKVGKPSQPLQTPSSLLFQKVGIFLPFLEGQTPPLSSSWDIF